MDHIGQFGYFAKQFKINLDQIPTSSKPHAMIT